jgi:uncharacterized membrane protein YesL
METMKRTIFLIIIAGWLLVPTGTPDDIITIYLIKMLGVKIYSMILLTLFILMVHYKINFEKIKKAMGMILHGNN